MATKTAKLSEKAKEVLEMLRNSDVELTLAEINEKVDGVNSSHLTALRNRGFVSAEKVEKEVATVTVRKVNSYSAVELQDQNQDQEWFRLKRGSRSFIGPVDGKRLIATNKLVAQP